MGSTCSRPSDATNSVPVGVAVVPSAGAGHGAPPDPHTTSLSVAGRRSSRIVGPHRPPGGHITKSNYTQPQSPPPHQPPVSKRVQAAHTLHITAKLGDSDSGVGGVGELDEDETKPNDQLHSLKKKDRKQTMTTMSKKVKSPGTTCGSGNEEIITTHTTVTVTATTTEFKRKAPTRKAKPAAAGTDANDEEGGLASVSDSMAPRSALASMLKDDGLNIGRSTPPTAKRSSFTKNGEVILHTRVSPSSSPPPASTNNGNGKSIRVVKGQGSPVLPAQRSIHTPSPPPPPSTNGKSIKVVKGQGSPHMHAQKTPPTSLPTSPTSATARHVVMAPTGGGHGRYSSIQQEKEELTQLLKEMRMKSDGWISHLERKQATDSHADDVAALVAHRESVDANRAAALADQRATMDRKITALAADKFQMFQAAVESDKLIANMKIDIDRNHRRMAAEEAKRTQRRESRNINDEQNNILMTPQRTTNNHTNTPQIDTSMSPSHTPMITPQGGNRQHQPLQSPTSALSAASTVSVNGIQLLSPARGGGSSSLAAFTPSHATSGIISTPGHPSSALDQSIEFVDDHAALTLPPLSPAGGVTGAPASTGGGIKFPPIPERFSSAASEGAEDEPNITTDTNNTTTHKMPQLRSSTSTTATLLSFQDELLSGSSSSADAKCALLTSRASELPNGPSKTLLLNQIRMCQQVAEMKRLEEATSKRKEELVKEQEQMKQFIQQAKEAKEILMQNHKRRSLNQT